MITTGGTTQIKGGLQIVIKLSKITFLFGLNRYVCNDHLIYMSRLVHNLTII